MFYCCFFFNFFSTRDLRGLWANLRKILPHVRKHVKFINAGPKVWGSATQKILGAKNMLNLVQFRTPSHFERECLRNGWRCLQFENLVHYSVPSRVQWNKFAELWSTNYCGDLEVQLYPQNRLIRKTIFRPLGGAAPWNLYTHHRMANSC